LKSYADYLLKDLLLLLDERSIKRVPLIAGYLKVVKVLLVLDENQHNLCLLDDTLIGEDFDDKLLWLAQLFKSKWLLDALELVNVFHIILCQSIFELDRLFGRWQQTHKLRNFVVFNISTVALVYCIDENFKLIFLHEWAEHA